MTAPALIALAPDSSDHRAAATITALTEFVACMRPDLLVRAAYLTGDSSLAEVAADLAGAGCEEAVVVPLTLDDSFDADIGEAIDAIHRQLEGVRLRASKPLGLESVFLDVLDARLRSALAAARVRELDGLVLAAAGSSNVLTNESVARVARAWGKRHHLPTIAAFASLTPPAAGEAVRSLRAEGRRHVAVGQLFLAPCTLTDLVGELSAEAGAVAVAEPLGVDAEIAYVVLARYAVGAVDLVPLFA